MRGLARQPGFTIVAIIALALGTGANTAIFSVVNAVLLRPLNYAAPERLVMVWGTNSRSNQLKDGLSVPNLLDYREQSSLLEHVAAYSQADFNLSRGGEPIHVQGAFVTADYFTALGVEARHGRVFSDGEDQSRAPRVVVISDALWQRQFAGSTEVLDQPLQLNGDSFTVVGILPRSFQPVNAGDELFVPLALDGGDIQRTPPVGPPEIMKLRQLRFLYAFGRLKPGATVAQAQSEMSAIAAHNETLYPNENANIGVNLVGMQEAVVGNIESKLKLLLIVVAAVLLRQSRQPLARARRLAPERDCDSHGDGRDARSHHRPVVDRERAARAGRRVGRPGACLRRPQAGRLAQPAQHPASFRDQH